MIGEYLIYYCECERLPIFRFELLLFVLILYSVGIMLCMRGWDPMKWYIEPDTQRIPFRFALIWRQFEHIIRTSIDRLIEFTPHSNAEYCVAVPLLFFSILSDAETAGQNETTTTISWNTCNKFYANAKNRC